MASSKSCRPTEVHKILTIINTDYKNMRQISLETIEKAVKTIDNFNDDEYLSAIKLISEQQPDLTSYMLGASEAYNNEDLEDYILYYILVIYKAFEIQNLSLNIITDKTIDEHQAELDDIIASFISTDEIDVLEEYVGQSNLIYFILSELSTPDDDGAEIDSETAGHLFVTIIPFIYYLSNAIKS